VGGVWRLPVETMAMQAPQATLNGVGKLQKNDSTVWYCGRGHGSGGIVIVIVIVVVAVVARPLHAPVGSFVDPIFIFTLLDQLVIGAGNPLLQYLQYKWSVISAGNRFHTGVFRMRGMAWVCWWLACKGFVSMSD
jgi:hypothetical protein